MQEKNRRRKDVIQGEDLGDNWSQTWERQPVRDEKRMTAAQRMLLWMDIILALCLAGMGAYWFLIIRH